MKRTPCPLCDSNDFEELYSKKALDKYEISIVKCQSCGFIHTNPALTPKQSSDYIFNEYYEGKKDDSGFSPALLERLRKRAVAHAEYITSAYPSGFKGRVLDVGCAMGFFLNQMKKRNWDTFGLEPDEACYEYATQKNGHSADREIFHDWEAKGTFDLVYFSHVFDDLYDINAVVEKVKSILNPGGKLFIEVPNGNRNMLGDQIPIGDLIETQYFFTPTHLKKLLNKHNFNIVKWRSIEPIPCNNITDTFCYPFKLVENLIMDPEERILIQMLSEPEK